MGLACVKADVCVQQSEKPSTEDGPDELRRPEYPKPTPLEESNTPKVTVYYSNYNC